MLGKWGVTARACWPLSWHPNEAWAVCKRGSLDGMLNARMGRGSTHTNTHAIPSSSLSPSNPPPSPSLFPAPLSHLPRAPRTAPNGTGAGRERMRRALPRDRLSARPLSIAARPACDWKHTVNKCPLDVSAAGGAAVRCRQYTWP